MKVLLLAASAALALSACQRAVIHDNQVTVSENAGPGGTVQVTVAGKDGSVTTMGKQLPADLPPYAKLYPGGSLTSTVNTPGHGGMIAFTTKAAPQAVVDFYKADAAQANLTSVMDSSTMNPGGMGAHVMVFSQTGTQRSMSVTVEQQSDGTKVAVMYGSS
ncbi:MAG: hypothetical protein ACHP84_14780 [Caulobacterales bacterium]